MVPDQTTKLGLFAGISSPLTDSNRRPPPYHSRFRGGTRGHARFSSDTKNPQNEAI